MNSSPGSRGHWPDSVPRSPRGPCCRQFQLPPGGPHMPLAAVLPSWPLPRGGPERSGSRGRDGTLRLAGCEGKGWQERGECSVTPHFPPGCCPLIHLPQRSPKTEGKGPGGSPSPSSQGWTHGPWRVPHRVGAALPGTRSSPGSRSTGAVPEPHTALPVQPRGTHADPRGRASWPGPG